MARNYRSMSLPNDTIDEVLEKLWKLETCDEGESANTFFGKRDYTNFFPTSSALEDTARELLKFYNLHNFVGLPGEDSFYVKFSSGPEGKTLAFTEAEGDPKDDDFALLGIEVTDRFLDPNLTRYKSLLRVFIHEIVHAICMSARLSHVDNGQHKEDFQRVRIQLERITGVDLSPH